MKRQFSDVKEEPEQQQQQQPNEMQQQEQPPLNITKEIMGGQTRDYYYLKTVKSLDELDHFRFQNFCAFYASRPSHACKSYTMPCKRKKKGKTCDFEMLGLCPNLANGAIHVYAHSQHSHVLMAEERRSLSKREKDLMPDANPPAIFRTSDNLEWTFLRTLPDYDKMQKFSLKNQCQSKHSSGKWWRIRFPCYRRSVQNCKFMLLAMQSTRHRFHVYKHDEHNHGPAAAVSQSISNETQQSAGSLQNIVVGQEEMVDDDEEEEMEDEEEDLPIEEEQYEAGGSMEIEIIDEPPPKKMIQIQNVMGDMREYAYLKTVMSIEELDQFRFENYCLFVNGKPEQILEEPYIMPCTRKERAKACHFELLAVRHDLNNHGIHVYAFAQHNHPFESAEEKRSRCHSIQTAKKWMPLQTQTKYKLMPSHAFDEDPPPPAAVFFDPVENIEWTFVKTFPDYEEMLTFPYKNQCVCTSRSSIADDAKWWRRFACNHSSSSNCAPAHNNCPFMFLAMKSTQPGYHVYRHGEHNHPIIIAPKEEIQEPANCLQLQQQEQQQMKIEKD